MTHHARDRWLAGTLALLTASVLAFGIQPLFASGKRSLARSHPMWFGAWVKPRSSDPLVTGNVGEDAVINMESEIGRTFSIDHVYYHFNDVWPNARQVWDRKNGRIPLINWSPEQPFFSWSQIANRAADSIIDARAKRAKKFGSTILLAFHHEPEDDTARYGSPADYVAAWRHIVARFHHDGATNVKFVLILTAFTYAAGQADQWYPGSRVINYVGADGYNWFGARANTAWRDVGQIFAPFYSWSVEKGKPAIITETGCLEDPNDPTHKANWFQNAGTWLASKPNIVGFVYFNSDRMWPWWADTSAASLAAYSALGHDPIFSRAS